MFQCLLSVFFRPKNIFLLLSLQVLAPTESWLIFRFSSRCLPHQKITQISFLALSLLVKKNKYYQWYVLCKIIFYLIGGYFLHFTILNEKTHPSTGKSDVVNHFFKYSSYDALSMLNSMNIFYMCQIFHRVLFYIYSITVSITSIYIRSWPGLPGQKANIIVLCGTVTSLLASGWKKKYIA